MAGITSRIAAGVTGSGTTPCWRASRSQDQRPAAIPSGIPAAMARMSSVLACHATVWRTCERTNPSVLTIASSRAAPHRGDQQVGDQQQGERGQDRPEREWQVSDLAEVNEVGRRLRGSDKELAAGAAELPAQRHRRGGRVDPWPEPDRDFVGRRR